MSRTLNVPSKLPTPHSPPHSARKPPPCPPTTAAASLSSSNLLATSLRVRVPHLDRPDPDVPELVGIVVVIQLDRPLLPVWRLELRHLLVIGVPDHPLAVMHQHAVVQH